MSSYVGPNIADDGLVFAYDMGNTDKSWRGKPTVNLITNPTNEVVATVSEFAVFQNLSPIFDAQGPGIYSISADIKTPKPGAITVYTASGGVEYNIGYYTANCETYYKRFYFDNISVTQTDPAQSVSNLSFYGGYGSGLFPSIKNVQLEKNNFSTPFVVGTRSNTQSVLDLTNTYTPVATNLTYNSNNTFSFNGSNNYIDSSPINSTGISTQSLTWECWVQPLSATGDIINMQLPVAGWNMCPMFAAGQRFSARVWSNANLSAITTFSLGQYYHLVLVRDNAINTNSFYVNGVLQASQVGAYSSSGGANNHYFGRAGAQATNTHFNGQIPAAKIYNRALTADEVRKNYNALRGRFNI